VGRRRDTHFSYNYVEAFVRSTDKHISISHVAFSPLDGLYIWRDDESQKISIPNQNPSPVAALGEEMSSDNAVAQGERMGQSTARLQASRWLVELDATDQIETLWPLFEAWLEESPNNRKAYHLAERARCETEVLRTLLHSCVAARAEEVTRESLLTMLGMAPRSWWRRAVHGFVSRWFPRTRAARRGAHDRLAAEKKAFRAHP